MIKSFKIILSPLLLPLSLLYGTVLFIRNKIYDWRLKNSFKPDIPLISVGNITVGGTGKTPHIEYLTSLLQKKLKVAVLSRGYKRKSKGFVLAKQDSTVHDIGDEPRQIKQKFKDVHVAVDANRTNGVKELLRFDKATGVILLDDAYQHRKVTPGLSILLIDYSRPLFKDFMLPLGNLREPAFGKKRANVIVVTKCPHELSEFEQKVFIDRLKPLPTQEVFFSTFEYGEIVPVFSNANLLKDLNKVKNLLLVTGIANPKSLNEFLKNNFPGNVLSLNYPDHYDFKPSDIDDIKNKFSSIEGNNKIIITTEKDATRLQIDENIPDILKQNLYYIPVKVKFLNKQTNHFNQIIFDYVSKN